MKHIGLFTSLLAASLVLSVSLTSCGADNTSKAITKKSTSQAITTAVETTVKTTQTTTVATTTTVPTGKISSQNYGSSGSSGSSGNSSSSGSSDSSGYQKYDYSDVSSNGNVSDTYFKDAIFLGNSILLGLHEYTDIKGSFYSRVSLAVDSVFTKEFVKQDGTTRTAINAIKHNNSFTKVYIMFGTNELGWNSSDAFIKKYEQILDVIENKNPDAVIYVMSILPVTASHSASHSEENNSTISRFNKKLRSMASRRGVVYLDIAAALSDSSGALPSSSSFDGVHIGPKLCRKWVDYLKTHAKLPPVTTTKRTTAKPTTTKRTTTKPTTTHHTTQTTIHQTFLQEDVIPNITTK